MADINTGPCLTFNLFPSLPQLPTPLDFSLGLGIAFPPPALLALINNAIPCCHFNFTPFTLNFGLGLPLTPFIIAINALMLAVYKSVQAEANAAGIPSQINIPKCPW